MDPGSSAPLSDPRGALERLAARAGASFPALTAARERTAARTAEATAALAAAGPAAGAGAGVSVCVFGSWARAELTDASDDDWAVLLDDGEPAAARALLDHARSVLGSDERGPGTQGVFGDVIEAPRLARDIGLDEDTNTNTTRRMLLLLESLELHGSARGAALDRILARYLDQTLTDFQPPRFLLNDLVRYWRTICVDFEGKQAAAGTHDAKWAMRNAKLRTSRKLLFAGGLVPLLLCRTCRAHEMPAFLRRWLDAPALDRLAAAFLLVDAEEAGVRTLDAYDRWLALNGDPVARADLASVSFATRERSAVFGEVRAIGETFENGLVALLFSTQLGQVTRKYAIF
jgi:hypothetical protein